LSSKTDGLDLIIELNTGAENAGTKFILEAVGQVATMAAMATLLPTPITRPTLKAGSAVQSNPVTNLKDLHKMESDVWGAKLHHVQRESDQPEKLVELYSKTLGFAVETLSANKWLLTAPERCLIVSRGQAYKQPMHAFVMKDKTHLHQMLEHCGQQDLNPESIDNPVLGDAFCVIDPEGREVVFGIFDDAAHDMKGDPTNPASKLPARLQHVVVTSPNDRAVTAFYRDKLGFRESDNVFQDEPDNSAKVGTFLRSDPEHHSFAVFRTAAARPDHISFETTCWNDIRDWSDHFSDLHIQLWLGPGRRGCGNNLFAMIEDHEEYKLELSAEIEHLPFEQMPRSWKNEERSLNLWGKTWMRT